MPPYTHAHLPTNTRPHVNIPTPNIHNHPAYKKNQKPSRIQMEEKEQRRGRGKEGTSGIGIGEGKEEQEEDTSNRGVCSWCFGRRTKRATPAQQQQTTNNIKAILASSNNDTFVHTLFQHKPDTPPSQTPSPPNTLTCVSRIGRGCSPYPCSNQYIL